MTRQSGATALALAAAALACACAGCDSASGPNGESLVIDAILPPGAGAGTRLTIRGAGFGDDQGAGTVEIAAVVAAVSSWSALEIACTVPAGLPVGPGANVTVTSDAGRSATGQLEITAPGTCRITTDPAMDHYPCWSADGSWLYFSSTRSGGANWDVYRIPAIGGAAERVTFDDGADFYPDIRPATGEIAWSSQMTLVNNTENDFEIFHGYPVCIAPGGGCSVAMLTSNASRDLDPAWALNSFMGYWLAYTHEEVDQGGAFVGWQVVLQGGGGPVVLATGRQPCFSADGQWVVYTRDDNVYKIATAGGQPVQLTDTGHDWYPHWGWASDRIVFQRMNGGNFEDIFVMNADGTDVAPLVSTTANEYCPAWSPDGTRVAYHALIGGNFDIYVRLVP